MSTENERPPVRQRRAAVSYAVLMAIVAAFQAAAFVGAPVGEYTQGGGQPGPLSPGRRSMAGASMVLVSVFALGVLALHGIGPLRLLRARRLAQLRRVTLAYGVVSVPLNLLSPSAKERQVWGPFTVVTLGALLLAQSPVPPSRLRRYLNRAEEKA